MKLSRFVVDSPTVKAIIPTLLAAAIGVLSGALVTEITTPKGLAWNMVHHTVSLYGLIALTGIQVVFSRLIYESERDVQRFSETEYCIAYVRSRCLPEVAARYQELIRAGEGGEFKKAMDEIKEVLK